MRNNRSWLVLLVLPLLMASVLVAQGIPTGTILGRVINEGQGLPGTTVVAKSPALQGSRTAVTSANGEFAFVGLPPGDYTLTFTMSGFQTVTRAQKVSASQQVNVNAEMSLTAIAAEATVVAQSETISQTATQATTYTADVLSKLPTGRTVTSAVLLSPGVNANAPNGISISGAQSTENLYTVNGVVITDNVRSTANNLFIEDAIQETTTTTSGVSAEYGRFTGGVINSVTKSGGNTFSGSFRTTFNNDDWRAYSAYRTAAGVNPQEGTFNDKTVPTYEATLGGPIVKDRVWFFGAGRYYDQSKANSYLTLFTNIPYTGGTEELRYEAKLTVSPLQNHTLTGSYINIGTDQYGYAFTPISDLASVYDRQLPQDLLAINYNGVLTDSLFLDAQYSKRQVHVRELRRPLHRRRQGHRHPGLGPRHALQRARLLRRLRPRDARQRQLPDQGDLLPLDEGTRLAQSRPRLRRLRRAAALEQLPVGQQLLPLQLRPVGHPGAGDLPRHQRRGLLRGRLVAGPPALAGLRPPDAVLLRQRHLAAQQQPVVQRRPPVRQERRDRLGR
jgi:hypothetical protein